MGNRSASCRVVVILAVVSSVTCGLESQRVPADELDARYTTVTLTADTDGMLELCDGSSECQTADNPNACSVLELTVNLDTGETCQSCRNEIGDELFSACGGDDAWCDVLTGPEPDCLVCYFRDSFVFLSTCTPQEPGDPGDPTDPGDPVGGTCAAAASASGAPYSAASGWTNAELAAPGTQIVRGRFLARVGADNANALFGLSSGAIDEFADMPCIVRFAPNGLIDVRDGGAYGADVDVPFTANTWYELEIAIDYATATYDVLVAECGGVLTPLLVGAAFRADAPSAPSTFLGLWSASAAEIEIFALGTTPATCAPRTCAELDAECGSLADGCGGTLSCGSCPGGVMCVNNDCQTSSDFDSWPTSRQDALARSPYWNPSIQIEHVGTYRTQAPGEVVENLRIVNGELVIAHDDVKVRNVTSAGLTCVFGGNYPIEVESGVTGVEIEGVDLGPDFYCWDATCGMPRFPSAGVMVHDGAEVAIRACATRFTGDAFKFTPTASAAVAAVIEDCHTELGRGVWLASSNCDTDHTDTVQVQSDGAISLVFRRMWMDALPFFAGSDGAPMAQVSSPGGATNLQLKAANTGALTYDTVRLHSGNFSLRINNAPITLNVINSVSLGSVYGPLQAAGNVTAGQWTNNTVDSQVWQAP